MRTSRATMIVVVACAAAMTMAACGSKSKSTATSSAAAPGSSTVATSSAAPSSSAATKAFVACMVLDTGGVDDKSFNQSSWAGLQAANKANPSIQISYVPSNSGNDYTPNLTAEANKKCDTTIAVGGLMSDNVKAVAASNPTLHFAEVDAPSSGANVYGLQYNTAQGGFLGGYLAAGFSKTGKVATWGGLDIPPVTIYMDGFWEGVQYYNAQKGTKVQVLGWDEGKQKAGTFSASFTDQNKGKQISDTFISQGADVIFPVAGGAGLGSGAAAQSSGGKVSVLWVDTDGCVTAAQYCGVFLGSVTKNLTDSVTQYVNASAGGAFPTGSYIGDLSNNGTGLVLGTTYASKVPQALQDEVTQVKADIISGKIKITSPSQPKA